MMVVGDDIGVASGKQWLDDGTANQTGTAGDEDFRVWIHCNLFSFWV